MPFDYDLDFTKIDFRQHPELYRIGRGAQGVLMVQPYKSEILLFWRFKTVAEAQESAEKIYSLFIAYKQAEDFVGMDMARKFLQRGYTRARRYKESGELSPETSLSPFGKLSRRVSRNRSLSGERRRACFDWLQTVFRKVPAAQMVLCTP